MVGNPLDKVGNGIIPYTSEEPKRFFLSPTPPGKNRRLQVATGKGPCLARASVAALAEAD